VNERRSFFAQLAAVALGLFTWRTAKSDHQVAQEMLAVPKWPSLKEAMRNSIPITPAELYELAGEITQGLLISDLETRDSALVTLKRTDPVLHSLVLDRFKSIREAVAEAEELMRPKPKVDVNVAVMQIKRSLRIICDSQGIPCPPELE
jgi:hypothetical protein